jgi:hypothetical protein
MARGLVWRTGSIIAASTALLAALGTQPAAAQYRGDRAAQRELEKAISRQYLGMKFDEAEDHLVNVIASCKNKCRPATIGKAWMYVGIVRGSGKDDQAGARKAFAAAFAADPRIRLDEALATAETRDSYEAARARREAPIGEEPGLEPPDDTESGVAEPAEAFRQSAHRAGLACTPDMREVQSRRPIPIECRGDAEEVRFSVRYQVQGESGWKTLEMSRQGTGYRAQIPCESTLYAGPINFYVIAADAADEPVETFGSKSAPERFDVDPQSDHAPAFPGEAAPERCPEPVFCPPDFPGCDDTMGDGGDSADEESAPYPKNWLGVHFAADIGFIGGSNVCSTENEDFECFASGSPYPEALPATVAGQPGELGDPYPGTSIRSGASGGTLRTLLSFDHALSQRFSLGARVGYAFGGAPGGVDGRSFLPFHAEGRLQYWLRGLGENGVRPYLHIGGGVAQVDIRKSDVTVRDCSQEAARQSFLDCIDARNAYAAANDPELPTRTLDSYRKLGNAFATTGGGVHLPLSPRVDLQVNLNAMFMMPSVGFVLQPSIGLGYEL